MNASQRQNILNAIENIKSLDIYDSLKASYPEGTDLRDIHFEQYSAEEMITLIKKCIGNFQNKLESKLGLILPYQLSTNNEYGVINVLDSLSNIFNSIKSNQFNTIENELNKLIYYQVIMNFWDTQKNKTVALDPTEIEQSFHSLQLAKTSIESLLERAMLLHSDYSNYIKDLNQFIDEKKSEIADIKEMSVKASNEQTQIASLLNESETVKASINNIYSDQKENLTKANKSLEDVNTLYTNYQTELAKLSDDLSEKIQESEVKLEDAKKAYDFMKSKEDEIIKLTGYAADGSLGSKFDERKKDLNNKLGFWLWAVIITTAASIAWVVIVFVYLRTSTEYPYLDILVNLIKTTPAFIFLGFVFSHYSKERAIQEEYAFKSAIAMTLTAYSDMLENADNKDNQTRQQMLTKAIDELYKQPMIHKEKEAHVFSFNTKHLAESVKNLTEVVKEIKK